MIRKICFASCICFLWISSASAEYVILKGNTYIADVRIITIDSKQLVFMKNEKQYTFSMNAIERISAEAPRDGILLDLGSEFLTTPETQDIAKLSVGTTLGAHAIEEKKDIRLKSTLSFEQQLRFQTGLFGGRYWQGKNKLDGNTAENLIRSYSEVYGVYQQGENASLLGMVLEASALCLMVYPAVEYFREVEYPNWTLAAMGITLLMPALFINTAAGKKYKDAAELYNQKRSEVDQNLSWTITPFAIKLSWAF